MQKVIVDLKLLKVKLRTYRLLKTCSSRTARLHAAIYALETAQSPAARLHVVIDCCKTCSSQAAQLHAAIIIIMHLKLLKVKLFDFMQLQAVERHAQSQMAGLQAVMIA
jgi:hypothetical protein